MIERAFAEARQHKDNKRNALRQFAITQARQLLEAAGVVDPATHDQAVATRPQRAVEQPFFEIPEDLGVRLTQDIGGKTPEQLEAEVIAAGRKVTIYGQGILRSSEFSVLEEVTTQELLKLPVSALGLRGTPTTAQLLQKIPQSRLGKEYVLELPRAEVGPHLAIADSDQPENDFYYVMHEPIADRRGFPLVFEVEHASYGRFLHGAWAGPDFWWDPDSQLIVTLRKIEPVNS